MQAWIVQRARRRRRPRRAWRSSWASPLLGGKLAAKRRRCLAGWRWLYIGRMRSYPRVLIAGGGIGGLTAALALARMGCEVQVYEQAAELREVGAGIQLAANGT